MSFVQIENVTKSYTKNKVLDKVSLTIEEGEFITLLGPSGCGKSTLLRAIAGLNDIDTGAIIIGGKDITCMPPKKRNIGMVFQSYALFPNMTVYDNIAFGLKMDGLSKKQIIPLVEEMLDVIDLRGKENHYPNQLSGGQQQRVALARALVKKPTVLLLDEPLSALDAKIRRILRNEIRRIQQRLNMTTVFVTHDQEEALSVSDRIYIMNHGTVEQVGTPNEIYNKPRTEFVARFIGNYNVWSRDQVESASLNGAPVQGNMFAVRPEAIQLFELRDADPLTDYTASGTITFMTILGNVIRYEINVDGLNVKVDRLNDLGLDSLNVGSVVKLNIPLEEWKHIEKTV
ncbi:putative spermidine/putrescine transport system ATP-binding protein [Paenibacillus sp. DS2015]|uniref:ABC transporter ATP-binding protein n=1 Tax=Paenibacillus sp. DS2015 TaxID=3373917 RepID=UPI003D23923F